MIVLTIDTATPAVVAGLVRREVSRFDVVAERVTVDARAHAERLTPNVLEALADAALGFADIDAVVVGCGPGPFTGLRVGMATAAAYGHALDVPVYGVCSLDAIGVHTRGDVLVVTDARRREVYWARYRDGVRVAGPAVDAPADVPVDQVRAVAGSPPHAAHFDLPRWGHAPASGRYPRPASGSYPHPLAGDDPAYPTPDGLARAVPDWEAVPAPLVPLYLRRPDAKSLAEREVGNGWSRATREFAR